MNPFEMVVAIVFIVSLAAVLKAKARGFYGDGSKDNRSNPASDAENMRLQREVKELKERLAVLERLATDDQRTVELDREIERLRDRTHS